MAEFILSERTRTDLRDIWTYTVRTWSEEQANKYYYSLLEACDYIAEKTDRAGKSYEVISRGLYGFHCGRHIIFYRVLAKNKVRIVRILHDRMDFRRHM